MLKLKDWEGSNSDNSQVTPTRSFHPQIITINSGKNVKSNYPKALESDYIRQILKGGWHWDKENKTGKFHVCMAFHLRASHNLHNSEQLKLRYKRTALLINLKNKMAEFGLTTAAGKWGDNTRKKREEERAVIYFTMLYLQCCKYTLSKLFDSS